MDDGHIEFSKREKKKNFERPCVLVNVHEL